MKASPRLGQLRSFPALALTAACALALACSSSSPGGGSGGSGTGGTTPGTGGSTPGTGGSTPGSGGSKPGTGGTTGTGGSSGSGGANTGSGGSNTTGSGGAGTGSGGSTGSGGANGGHGGANTGSGGATPGSGGSTGGGGSTAGCPANATFCSGFEEASGPPTNAPVGTATLQAYTGTFTDLMALDTSVVHSGKQSLRILKGASMSAYRMLSVPIPGSSFWVRAYMRSDDTFGNMTAVHNAFFQAQMTPDPNSGGQIQFAEQWCQVLLNANDKLYPDGLSSCSTTGPTLSANTWHCVEAFFDGANGTVQVYGDGTKMIDAQNWSYAKETYGTFEFGFHLYSGPDRNLWYDDVVVAPSRIGCQ